MFADMAHPKLMVCSLLSMSFPFLKLENSQCLNAYLLFIHLILLLRNVTFKIIYHGGTYDTAEKEHSAPTPTTPGSVQRNR